MTGVLTVVLVLLVLGALWLAMAWRGLVAAREAADRTWSAIDGHLRERHELVGALIAAVEAEAGSAADDLALGRLVAAREQAVAASSPWERGAAERHLVAAVGALAEGHAGLGASPAFVDLHARLTAAEDAIQASRRVYNADVRLYRTRRGHLPGAALRRFGDFEDRPYFELDHTRERGVPTPVPALAA
jgi:LemA protein